MKDFWFSVTRPVVTFIGFFCFVSISCQRMQRNDAMLNVPRSLQSSTGIEAEWTIVCPSKGVVPHKHRLQITVDGVVIFAGTVQEVHTLTPVVFLGRTALPPNDYTVEVRNMSTKESIVARMDSRSIRSVIVRLDPLRLEMASERMGFL